ncbi:MAG: hypothetical protein JWN33_211 [Candidatus Saccharibacteria bacterium]|nr:hypothetical protein [Candidatus Saccharibacteria bacterium]
MLEQDISIPESLVPRYDLSHVEIKSLTNDLLAERSESLVAQSQIVIFEAGSNSAYTNIGRYIERVVFEESFGNDTQEMVREYGPYEAASLFFIAIDTAEAEPVGVIRIIENSPAGLKTLNDVQNPPFSISFDSVVSAHSIDDMDNVWDIGTAAVLPCYRFSDKGSPSLMLYASGIRQANILGIEHVVSLVDDKAYRNMTQNIGIPFQPLADALPASYLGSKLSHAAYGRVDEFIPSIIEKMKATADTGLGKRISPIVMKYLFEDNTIPTRNT